MSKFIEDVKEFHTLFDHPINDSKDDIDLNIRQLRIKLLFEELEELAYASDVKDTFYHLCEVSSGNIRSLSYSEDTEDGNNVDKVEELDALCDIEYVLSGASLAIGHHANFDKAFQEVHDSNMSKLCNNPQEVEDTIDMYVNERGMSRDDIASKEKKGKFIVYRLNDGKILKNKYYKAADLKQFV